MAENFLKNNKSFGVCGKRWYCRNPDAASSTLPDVINFCQTGMDYVLGK